MAHKDRAIQQLNQVGRNEIKTFSQVGETYKPRLFTKNKCKAKAVK